MPSALFRFSFFFILALVIGHLHADVVSITGQIRLDVNDDGQAEATLNHSGLRLGTGLASSNLDVSGNGLISGSLHVGGSYTPVLTFIYRAPLP